MAMELEEQLVDMEEEKERKLEELEIDHDKDHQTHNSKKRGGINKYRATEHEFPRFQTKIKDCRHCRRM
ncbi:hypothetical protein K7X08_022986 [Anisodus acutangulus]|uniref:Uncharacterized protein n=1 Tax=Anisodus acutangulus TaxID=402998 RepID=A0A9Q1MBM2_9SOLA|nr:hypothetical protein K7X08_022986 [Anisodus acutangulus]